MVFLHVFATPRVSDWLLIQWLFTGHSVGSVFLRKSTYQHLSRQTCAADSKVLLSLDLSQPRNSWANSAGASHAGQREAFKTYVYIHYLTRESCPSIASYTHTQCKHSAVGLVTSVLFIYSPISHIINLPQGALQSVQHMTPSVLRPSKIFNGEIWKKPHKEREEGSLFQDRQTCNR